MQRGKSWSALERAAVVAYYCTGRARREGLAPLAAQLGRTHSQIVNQAKRWGLRSRQRRVSADQERRADQLVRRGWTTREIATDLGLARDTVTRLLLRLGHYRRYDGGATGRQAHAAACRRCLAARLKARGVETLADLRYVPERLAASRRWRPANTAREADVLDALAAAGGEATSLALAAALGVPDSRPWVCNLLAVLRGRGAVALVGSRGGRGCRWRLLVNRAGVLVDGDGEYDPSRLGGREARVHRLMA